jgi:hypothetical protein
MATRPPSSRAATGVPGPAGTGRASAAKASRAVAVAAAVVVLVASFLVFFRLDQRLLWVDEAETALLGRSILIYGVPKAYDGKTLVSQEAGREYHADYVWRWTPWLEKYLAAGSFAVLGESTFAARLPFALVGLLSVVSVYPLALALFRDRWVGVLAMAFLAFSVPFLLHVRQCRYYSLAILASIWIVYFFVALGRGRRGAVAGLTAAMTVLFHSNTLAFLGTAAGLVPCVVVLRFDRAALRRGTLAAGLLLLLNLPWALYFDILGKTEEKLYAFSENFRSYLELTNRYTFPAAAPVIFLVLARLLRRRRPLLDAQTWRPFLALVALLAVYVVTISAAPWFFYRYTVNLLPLAAVLLAFMCRGVLRWSRIAGTLFTAGLLLTAIFHQLSVWPMGLPKYNLQPEGRSFPIYDTFFPLGNYLHELTHPYVGPMEHLIGYLSQNAQPGDRIFISYGDLVLKFYTEHEVRGGQSGQTLTGWPEPEWVIIRSFFRFADRPQLRSDAEKMLAWLNNDVHGSDYQQEPVSWADVPWDDIPEPQLHWFRVPEGGTPMQVYHRVTRTPPAAPP